MSRVHVILGRKEVFMSVVSETLWASSSPSRSRKQLPRTEAGNSLYAVHKNLPQLSKSKSTSDISRRAEVCLYSTELREEILSQQQAKRTFEEPSFRSRSLLRHLLSLFPAHIFFEETYEKS